MTCIQAYKKSFQTHCNHAMYALFSVSCMRADGIAVLANFASMHTCVVDMMRA
jgi:hypothetical protein